MSIAEPQPFPATGVALLAVSGLSFSYGDRPILEHVSLSIGPHEFVALTGTNGSGKSTLVKAALGLLRPTSGDVQLFGTDRRHFRESWRLGYVPQRPQLALDLPATVEEIVMTGRLAYGLWWRRLRKADHEAVDHALTIAGLEGVRNAKVGALSGGQQQRTFIARALASTPQLLILDEPTAGVDREAQERFRNALVHHVRVHGGSVLLVTHDMDPVSDDLDRVLVLRDGRLT